jgi:glutaredoxin
MVAKLLDTKGVEYQLVDVSEDPKLRQEVIEKSGAMSVPITVKGDWEDFVIGWNPSRLMSLI